MVRRIQYFIVTIIGFLYFKKIFKITNANCKCVIFITYFKLKCILDKKKKKIQNMNSLLVTKEKGNSVLLGKL